MGSGIIEKTCLLKNVSNDILSCDKYIIRPNSTLSVDLSDIQFKPVLDIFASNIRKGKLEFILDSSKLSADQVEELEYWNSGSSGPHKATHVSGGSDSFVSTDLLEAVVKRIQESAGPTILNFGSILDGEFLKRNGNTIISDPISPVDPYPIVDDVLLTPPGSPISGESYLINGIGVGAWSGHNYEVATWNGSIWEFKSYLTNDIILCSGTINPSNEGFWKKTATLWSYLGSDVVDLCLDIILDPSVLTPSDGDRYLINGVGIGAFVGHDYEIAQWVVGTSSWSFTSHIKGTQVSVAGEIIASNFGTYLKGTIAWELIPAVASALELKPNSRTVKGKFSRIRNQVGDYTWTGYRANMGTFIVIGNTNSAAGTYYFRMPRIGATVTNPVYVNPGWEGTIYVPPICRGEVAIVSRNGADIICAIKPGEMWDFKARNETTAGGEGWQTSKRIGSSGVDAGETIYVDGSRNDFYTPTGTEAYPYRTIQAGLDACPRLGLVKIKLGTYVENVTTVADKSVDAELGTLLTSTTGTTLTLTDDVTPYPADILPPFWRGISVEAQDAAGWAIHVISSGTWNPFLVWLDQGLQVKNNANGLWCEGGGVYLTDAGGVSGGPTIAFRIGNPASQIGGQIITGRNNISCAAGGVVFDIHENGFVLGDGGSFSADGSGAILAQMTGLGTPGTGLAFIIRDGRSEGPWKSMVRASGPNCQANFQNVYAGSWGQCDEEAIYMPDGGGLAMTDCSAGSDTRVALLFGNNTTPSSGYLELVRCEFGTNTGNRAVEIRGNVGGSMRETVAVNRNPAGLGAILCEHNGWFTLEGGRYEGLGPTCDHQTGYLFLLGGVDLIANGAGLPGGSPLMSMAGANLYRGHCNFRGSFQPVIASTETVLPSSFGMIGFGSSAATVQMSAGPLALPGGGSGYMNGSLFVHVPSGGPAQLYFNQGSESSPSWQLLAYVAGAPANWLGTAPVTMKDAMDRVSAAVAGLLGGPIP